MSKWTVQTLEQICIKITDGSHQSPKDCNSNFFMPSVKDMTNTGFDFAKCKTISEFDFNNLINQGCRPEKGDILIAKDGSVMKHVFEVKDEPNYVVLSSIAIVRPDNSLINSSFLSYAIKSPLIIEQILTNFVSGSGVPRIVLKDFKKVEISYPPLQEQQAIAEVLSSLDDKIDLLHRNNKTLEEMAETLFRQWFVEGAKEEWEVKRLDDILTTVGGTTPSTSNPEFWNGNINWTSPRDITTLSGIYLFNTERKITEAGLKKVSSGLLPEGTLLMSSRAPVGVLAFAEIPLCINQGYIAVLDNKGYNKLFIYLWLKNNMEYIHSYSNGSTFMEISKSAFKSLEITLPPINIIDTFCSHIKPLFDKIKHNEQSIQNLKITRDTLLPKLMSGQVRVSI